MSFNAFFKELSLRTGPAYGAGPAGFRRLMKRLGSPQNSYSIIHVAGTNGKGSVCYLCAEILRSAEKRTGLFISPHLHSPTERIQLNGCEISRRDFVRVCGRVLAAEVEKLNFFEILTAAAFVYFAEKKAECVVLETGLGGRKDPTNICRPAVSIITSVGLDHCQILGNTLSKIAREKAGIIKKNVPVFCPPLPREALAEMKQKARRTAAPLTVVREGQPFNLSQINWHKSEMILQKGSTRWPLHLLGEKQVQNACLVYAVCRQLGIPEQAIKQGFARVQVPGRFEVIHPGGKRIILDGAHNPQAVENLVKFLQKSPWAGKTAVVCGFMADKDYPAMLHTLAKHTADLYITTPGGPRAATVEQVKSVLSRGVPTHYFKSPAGALQAALQVHNTVLVTGSFYLVATLRQKLIFP